MSGMTYEQVYFKLRKAGRGFSIREAAKFLGLSYHNLRDKIIQMAVMDEYDISFKTEHVGNTTVRRYYFGTKKRLWRKILSERWTKNFLSTII